MAWRETLRLARRGVLDLKRDVPRGDAYAFMSAEASASLFDGVERSLRDVAESAKRGQPERLTLHTRAILKIQAERSEQFSPNVIAVLRGRVHPDEYVVYVAHLDHVGIGEPVRGDSIYNGAIDNASGVAAMLAIARAFTSLPERPARSILFLATTGEETGLLGSQYFIDHAAVRSSDMVAALNIDSPTLMLSPIEEIKAMGAQDSSLGAVVDSSALQFGWSVKHEPTPAGGSDHFSFARHGVPG